MGYAKQLGKQYNANTAWASLGTDQGAYERSNLSNTLSPIRELAIPGYSEYSTSGPRQSAPYEQNVMENIFGMYQGNKRRMSIPPVLMGDINNRTYGLLSSFENMPENFNAAALAGKYINRI